MGTFKNLTGKRFGKLVVKRFSHFGGKRNSFYECICDCGAEAVVGRVNLVSDHTNSCGCLVVENGNRRHTHRLRKTPLYGVWNGIKNRCYVHTSSGYKNYGLRGIVMCSEWRNDFKSFYDWAMANGWRKGLTIERNDVNGNYEPNNCRWATQREQMRNMRVNTLNEVKVRIIRNLHEQFGLKPKEVVQCTGVKLHSVYSVLNYNSWL